MEDMDHSTLAQLAKTVLDNEKHLINSLKGKIARKHLKTLEENSTMLSSMLTMIGRSSVNLLDLPMELLVTILSMLPNLHDLVRVSQVCRRLRLAASSASFTVISLSEARLPPGLLKRYLDHTSEVLTLTFETHECITFPTSLKQAIDVERAMPNLKQVVMKNGVLNSKFFFLKQLPLSVPIASLHSLQDGHHLAFDKQYTLIERVEREWERLEVWSAPDSDLGVISWNDWYRTGLLDHLMESVPVGGKGLEHRRLCEILCQFASGDKETIVSLEQFSAWSRTSSHGSACTEAKALFQNRLVSRKVLGMRRQQLRDSACITIFVE